MRSVADLQFSLARMMALAFAFLLACNAERMIGGSGAAGAVSGTSDGSHDVDADNSGADEADGEWEDSCELNICVPGVGDCLEDEKCMPYISEDGGCCVDATMCVPLLGDRKPGQDCRREWRADDCERDAFCADTGNCGPGVCLQMCDGSDPRSCADFGMPDATCIPHNDGVIPICHVMCDPLQRNCEDGETCFYSGFPEHGYLCWAPDPVEGMGYEGDPCNDRQSCNPGLQCWPAEVLEACKGESCCARDCDLGGDGRECGAESESCIPAFGPNNLPHPMYKNVGVCATN